MTEERQKQILDKGFNMFGKTENIIPNSYGSIKVGPKTLDDAVINLGALSKVNKVFGDKYEVLQAIYRKDVEKLREISRFFYESNGIYSRICDYFAFLYRYDWYIVPEVKTDNPSSKLILTDFNNLLSFFDNSNIKKLCGKIAKEVIINGVYFGYVIKGSERIIVQDLPVRYCRSRFSIGDKPVVEFNMRFFDEKFKDVNERLKILKMFPQDIQKGYMLYKQNKLTEDYIGVDWGEKEVPRRNDRWGFNYTSGWYPLDSECAVMFNLNGSSIPHFINAIPAIIDLDNAQDLDKRKQLQQLQKIVIQQLPLDKNGDLIFDIDESRDIHNNAVQMLQHSIGTDVLTTFADIKVEDIAETNASNATDTLERMERSAYNAMGTSRNLFNTDGNLSLEKSILDDASSIRDLILSFSSWLNGIASSMNKNKKKYSFNFYMLETTDYNYIELSKMYKEQTQLGYSKMLPQIALGHSQSSIIHTAYFENEILKLTEIMIPPLMSSTMSAETILGKNEKTNSSQNQSSKKTSVSTTEEKSAGRPEKSDDQKSEKTIANKESMS